MASAGTRVVMISGLSRWIRGQTIHWGRLYGGSGFEVTSHVTDDGIQQTTDNGFVLVGQTTSNMDGNVSSNHGAADVWVLKLNTTGHIQWTNTFGGKYYDMASGGINETPDGGYVFTGMTQSNNTGDVGLSHGVLGLLGRETG